MTRPLRIGLDVDGVLAHFTRTFLDYFGSSATDADIGEFDIVRALSATHPLPADAYAQFGDAVNRLNACSTIPPYPGARAFVDALREQGHEVLACTSPFNAAWLSQRSAWLERHMGIPLKQQIHCSRKELIDADVLIDDNWQHCHDFVNHDPMHRFALLFDQPWNQQPEVSHLVMRVKGYAGTLSFLRESK